VSISADITDDGTITSAELLYSLDGLVFQTVTATVNGTRYSGEIPAQADGQIVRYYFKAKDNLNNTTLMPNVPGQIPALFYTSRDGGCTIRDVQFTPYSNGRSGYTGDTLSLQGIVTASAASDNLGYVFIQQENQNEWAGIWVNGGSLITSLAVGDKVSVTGIVEEYFGLTRLSNISNASVISTGQTVPQPIVVNPAILSTYDFTVNEKYEGMLVKLENPLADTTLFVVDTNADFSLNRNNGEYRIGADVNDPNTGCRILAGRQNSTSFSSLNVSYVNSPLWQTTDGTMSVSPVIVMPGMEFSAVQGIMTYSFSNMKLLPRNNADMTLATGVKSVISKGNFRVFPNPASSCLRLSFADGSAEKIQLLNSLGQLLIQKEFHGPEADLEISHLPAGIYRLIASDKNGVITGTSSVSIQK
jgi:predicted extracellular nuclease